MRREQFTDRLITETIGAMLFAYAAQVRLRFEKIKNFVGAASDAPLFPQRKKNRSYRHAFQYHTSPREIGNRISSIFEDLKVISERTGEPIEITSKRLRHTVATVAAREGHGELIIAELLDHSDTQNVGIYVKATPEIIERIDKAIALRMAPLARAFAGTFIEDQSDAVFNNDHAYRIADPRFDTKLKPMGNCGRHGACGFLAPIACYTCPSFQAWVEGPHEEVLSYLLAERERLLKKTDTRIATINDRTILAVAEVVKHVRETKEGPTDDL
ncbi:hypothetical protein GCM10010971_25820 [Silvimonas amylolytica]|uniref:Phage integrase family protein n=2 Tax=Silvimonas amylolytica TaxID=449663 RepID=A0ABQ2PN81_9NEIS|nr:hypothetical protein GCM10010971_25820 [Silvimonas amylolytica]